ncbi:3-isopropylmalate dehydratase small subunit [Candidatus Spongiihabitans sp.]|uniref:3-isopropylmalate dehydratase small subunit n=1 Tax=Candidatus Spongiihabitans sp. TaxID=3101308 RepID=UPI003C7C33C8
MESFTTLDGLVMPLDRANIDTDAIIPKQYLKSIKRTGFGPSLFDEWRYLDHGEPGMDHSKRPRNPEFVLNQERYQGAQILLARKNFGCGSSREHAPWALLDYGFLCIIAPSFAEIFYNNCFKNGMLPVVLDEETVDDLFEQVKAQVGYRLKVDLPTQKINTPDGVATKSENKFEVEFEIESFRKHCLVNGLDDIALTLSRADAIKNYEQKRKTEAPWLFDEGA